jgi:hypothetical protein
MELKIPWLVMCLEHFSEGGSSTLLLPRISNVFISHDNNFGNNCIVLDRSTMDCINNPRKCL